MTTHARRRVWTATTLDFDEQAELAAKVRYAIGLELLVGEHAAARIRWELAPPPLRRDPPPPPRPLAYPPRSDDQVRARAAALGLSAGARGQWLRR